jgi:hypothetical protein
MAKTAGLCSDMTAVSRVDAAWASRAASTSTTG